jgi:hypothetical protein
MEKPKVIIDQQVYKKIMYWVDKSQYEVSGLGTVVVQDDGSLRVTGAILLPQVNTTTHTDISPENVCKAMYETRNEPGELRFWWHSHVQMGVFWSGEDMSTIKDIGKGGWVLATVFNQKRELRSAVYSKGILASPWRKEPEDVFLDELSTSIPVPKDPNEDAWATEYADKVKNVSYISPTYPHFYRAVGSSAQQNSTTGAGGTTREYLANNLWMLYTPKQIQDARLAQVAATRPTGMTKKHWSKIRGLGSEEIKDLLSSSVKFSEEAFSGVSTKSVDDYGFDEDDWSELTLSEWDKDSVTLFVEKHDLSPMECLRLAQHSVTPQEIALMLSEGFGAQDITRLSGIGGGA